MVKRLVIFAGLLLFLAGYLYETPGLERGILMISTALFIALTVVGAMWRSKGFLWVLAGLGLGFLEHLSKYTVNDYFQLIYLILPLGLYLSEQKKHYRQIVLLGALILNYKYLYLAMIKLEALKPQVPISITLMYGLVCAILWLAMSLEIEKRMLSLANATLEVQKSDLMAANEQLSGLMTELKSLTIVKERQHMAREIHDTVGHALTALVMKLEMTKHLLNDENARDKGYILLQESIDDGRGALKATRQVVETLTKERRTVHELQELISGANSHLGVLVSLKGEKNMEALSLEGSQLIYRAVQEAITNANKHSSLPYLNMQFQRRNSLFIADLWCCEKPGEEVYNTEIQASSADVLPSDSSKEPLGSAAKEKNLGSGGFGLKAMADRVAEAGGTLWINPDPEKGYHIHIELQAD